VVRLRSPYPERSRGAHHWWKRKNHPERATLPKAGERVEGSRWINDENSTGINKWGSSLRLLSPGLNQQEDGLWFVFAIITIRNQGEETMGEMGKFLIMAGIILIMMGALFLAVGKIPGIGKLPGDILIKKENFSFYFPLTTCILLSLILSLFLFLLNRR
jgi:hypothetical protein